MKKLLLLGDSIREGYEPFVREKLNGIAEVCAPKENGRFSKYTLWGVNLWLKEFGTPDVIHWNNGLWDVHHEYPMVEALTSLDEYLNNLKRIVNELRRTKAAIIFATTTPVSDHAIGRSNAEIELYNSYAMELMKNMHVEVNDLNAILKSNKEAYISDDKLHLNEEGLHICAGQIVDIVRKYCVI